MKTDDSFKKPGSVPFNWEVRPGIPKTQNPPTPPQRKQHLKPPPAGSYYFRPHLELKPESPQHTRSRRFSLARPDIVSSAGCFPGKRSGARRRCRPEQGYSSDPDAPSLWSVSTRKSTASPSSSSFTSYLSSPQPVHDAGWAGFGLF